MMGTVVHFLLQGHSNHVSFIGGFAQKCRLSCLRVLLSNNLFVNVCKKNYGEVGLQDALFANCGSCLHHGWERRWFMLAMCMSNFLQVFPTSMSAAHVPIKTLNADTSHAILDFQRIFYWKCCWPRNAATQHWNNMFRIYGIQIPSHRVIGIVRMWSRLKLPQKCRSSKTILGRAKLSVRNTTKI